MTLFGKKDEMLALKKRCHREVEVLTRWYNKVALGKKKDVRSISHSRSTRFSDSRKGERRLTLPSSELAKDLGNGLSRDSTSEKLFAPKESREKWSRRVSRNGRKGRGREERRRKWRERHRTNSVDCLGPSRDHDHRFSSGSYLGRSDDHRRLREGRAERGKMKKKRSQRDEENSTDSDTRERKREQELTRSFAAVS